MLEDDCRYLMVSKIPTVGISLKAQTEINGLLEGYLRHFSANQPGGLELLDVAQCCYKLTTNQKALRRTSAPSSWPRGNSLPHTIAAGGGLPISLLCLPRRGRSATT